MAGDVVNFARAQDWGQDSAPASHPRHPLGDSMKLEPVAWQFRFKHNLGEWRGCSSGDALLYGNLAECETRDLYAIPDGYVVVPLTDEIAAAMIAAKEQS